MKKILRTVMCALCGQMFEQEEGKDRICPYCEIHKEIDKLKNKDGDKKTP